MKTTKHIAIADGRLQASFDTEQKARDHAAFDIQNSSVSYVMVASEDEEVSVDPFSTHAGKGMDRAKALKVYDALCVVGEPWHVSLYSLHVYIVEPDKRKGERADGRRYFVNVAERWLTPDRLRKLQAIAQLHAVTFEVVEGKARFS